MKKKSFIDNVRVEDPCTQAWDEMVGNDKVRFCTHCAKDVNNLSAMTRKEAVRLVRKSGGSLCIRYVQRPETKAPMFAEQLTQITRRRVPLMAAGVMTATLSLSTLAYAQDSASRSPNDAPAATQVSECEDNGNTGKKKTEPESPATGGVLHGTVIDPQGAVVPNIRITLNDGNGKTIASAPSSADGDFRFDALPRGAYSLRTESAMGFAEAVVENIVVDDGDKAVDVALSVSSNAVTMGVIAVGPEYELPLTIAVSNDDLQQVRDLISRGEDVNGKEEDGTTAIFAAVDNGNVAMVQMLLDAGAKVNVRDEGKRTPLMMLDQDTPVEIVELVLKYGAKINRASTDGNTALMRAAYQSRPEVVKALVDAGANLDAQDEDGMTALMFAADEDNLETARILVLAGANVNLKDKDGDTAWDKTTDEDLEQLLESYGAVTDEETPAPEPQP